MINWIRKNYAELYRILQFRINIFVIEQNSIYEDLDGLDQKAMHFIGMDGNKILAYGRVHMDSETNFAVISRICIHKDYRDQKLGYLIMEKILAYIDELPNVKGSELDAQYHLQQFYKKLGFHAEGDSFDDGGVLHIKMLKPRI